MKQAYLLLITLLSFGFSQAQIVDITDANFKDALVNDIIADFDGDGILDGDVDTNNDGEIQVSEAAAVLGLNVNKPNDIVVLERIESIVGIEAFINLESLKFDANKVSSFDLSLNLALTELSFISNQITLFIDLSDNVNLTKVHCGNFESTNADLSRNTFFGMDLSMNVNLVDFDSSNSEMYSLRLNLHPNLTSVNCKNGLLNNLNIKNGNNSQLTFLDATNNPNLTCVKVDDVNYANSEPQWVIDSSASFSFFCDGNDILSFPDANFKNTLLNENCVYLGGSQIPNSPADFNNDGQIDYSEASAINKITISTPEGIESLEGIENFPVLQSVNIRFNPVNNVGSNPYLRVLWVFDHPDIITIDVSQFPELRELYCYNNNISILDLSENQFLYRLNCTNNQLVALYEKNGKEQSGNYEFSENPNLEYICVDEDELDFFNTKISDYGLTNCFVNTYCSFVPGGNNYTIEGNNIFDSDLSGCDLSDIIYPNLKFNITDGTNIGSFISNSSGNYEILVSEGSNTMTPELANPEYFIVNPSSVTIDFPTDTSPYNQDFCITPNGTKNDLEIILIPLQLARPGFDTDYELVYKNKGNTTLSGMVTLDFQDDYMDLVTVNPIADTQTTSNLSWIYSDLLPFESRSIAFTMNTNTPIDPDFPLNSGDTLDFTANINPVSGDELPDDNSFELHQLVVNSFDPNDKTCLEGATISPSRVGDYVHYMIRFENTGSASAVNIVVKDEIDLNKYDISTLRPITGSHDFVTRIRDANIVEFIFENINLSQDDASNDGYVSFKIKTQPTLQLGDTFSNTAEIYFDFNAPIITNTAVTAVEEPLSISDYNLNGAITLIPNPSNGTLELKNNLGTFLQSAQVININGAIIYELSLETSSFSNSISLKLESGIYFFKLYTAKGSVTKKLIIK